MWGVRGGTSPGSRGPTPAWALLQGVLTALGQDKAATLLGVVPRQVCHIDTENVVGHEAEHIHVARVFCMCGIVGGPAEAARGDLIRQLSIRVLPSRKEQPVTAGGRWAQCAGPGQVPRVLGREGLEVGLEGAWCSIPPPREGTPSPEAPRWTGPRLSLHASTRPGARWLVRAAALSFGNLGHSCLN